MELTYVVCPAWPDAAELRMLRVLLAEGAIASRSRAYAVQFHGWRVRVWHAGGPLWRRLQIGIWCPEGGLCAWASLPAGCRHDGEVFQ